ncbi:hypothetical protein OLMES_4921 [Oleiphilus messinensis]|uniref:Outer membrane protein beta-barrel domain-containing protein n=1 Tax=Oleiphilus messinensis TaxID=141451 RepID=A0A1Y0IFK1_9GAMM|nr:outer membrane beta-barrel protein [Oleiphilus messinensis]ARU58909.1 hypothetical protein OLMES_4921 [Oleiphilus messinensis]
MIQTTCTKQHILKLITSASVISLAAMNCSAATTEHYESGLLSNDELQHYLGVSFGHASVDNDSFAGDYSVNSLDLRYGVDIPSYYMGVESRLGWGSKDWLGDRRFEMKSYFSLYAKPQISIGPLSVYGLLGGSIAKLTEDRVVCGINNLGQEICRAVRNSSRELGFSYGIGTEVEIGQIGINLEYTEVLDTTSYDISRPAIGITFNLDI